MKVPALGTGRANDPVRPDLPDGFDGSAVRTDDGDYLLIPADQSDRIAALEGQVAQLLAALQQDT